MNGVLVVTLIRLGFSGTAFIPSRIFIYLSLQQFILSNLVLVLRRPWLALRASRLVPWELRSSFRVPRTRSVTRCSMRQRPFSSDHAPGPPCTSAFTAQARASSSSSNSWMSQWCNENSSLWSEIRVVPVTFLWHSTAPAPARSSSKLANITMWIPWRRGCNRM